MEVGFGSKYLKAYSLFVDFVGLQGENALADCPFCGRKKKLSVNVNTGVGRCWGCNYLPSILGDEGFNLKTFAYAIWQVAPQSGNAIDQISKQKRLRKESLVSWGARCWGDLFIVPSFDLPSKSFSQLHWCNPQRDTVLRGLCGLSVGVFMPIEENGEQDEVYLCEGLWDGVCVYERGKFAIAVPGACVFKNKWADYFRQKTVYLVYDNDVAGANGIVRVLSVLKNKDNVFVVKWGDRPKGYDIRDYLQSGNSLTSLVFDKPDIRQIQKQSGIIPREPIPCESVDELLEAWEKAFVLTNEFRKALVVTCAVASSTHLPGDALWLRLIGPPSCGKSSICDALAISDNVVELNQFTGFHSGWKEEDADLLSLIDGKVVVTKEGDLLVQHPRRTQLLAEARDLFDGRTTARYRNKVFYQRELKVTWILAGTSELLTAIDPSLGERFVDIRLTSDEKVEDEICRKRQATLISGEACVGTWYWSKEQAISYCKLAGFVDYLRDKFGSYFGEMPEELCNLAIDFAKVVSYLRVRPKDFVEKEVPARLSVQFTKLVYLLSRIVGQHKDAIYPYMRLVARSCCYLPNLIVLENIFRFREGGYYNMVEWLGEDQKLARKVVDLLVQMKLLSKTVDAKYQLTPKGLRLLDFVSMEEG